MHTNKNTHIFNTWYSTEQNTEQQYNNMQHTEENREQNTDNTEQRTEHSTDDLHKYSYDLYHEYIAIKNSNTIELYTISK